MVLFVSLIRFGELKNYSFRRKFLGTFFLRITQYNIDAQHARTLTPINTRTQTLPL